MKFPGKPPPGNAPAEGRAGKEKPEVLFPPNPGKPWMPGKLKPPGKPNDWVGNAIPAEEASETKDDAMEVATAEAEASPEESAAVAEPIAEETPLGTVMFKGRDTWGAGAAMANLLPSKAIDAERMLRASIVREIFEEL